MQVRECRCVYLIEVNGDAGDHAVARGSFVVRSIAHKFELETSKDEYFERVGRVNQWENSLNSYTSMLHEQKRMRWWMSKYVKVMLPDEKARKKAHYNMVQTKKSEMLKKMYQISEQHDRDQ